MFASTMWVTNTVRAELQPEPVPNVLSLATPYPDTYAVVHDFAFFNLIDSKFALVDIESRRFKGMLSAGQFATINLSNSRQEFYVGETLHSRGSRGQRQDVIAIYDFANLDVVAEVDLPPRRANTVINLGNSRLTEDERFLLVFMQNPGTSVAVIDLDSRKMVSEISTPGCALIYPTVERSFFMLCGDGRMLSITLDETGNPVSRKASEPFIDIDADPLSEKSAKAGGIWHFVSYRGQVQPIDARAAQPELMTTWWLATEKERAANWRPAGWHWTAGHKSGLLWVGMTPDGYDGSHKDPAPEIWLFDTGERERLARIELRAPAISISVTQHEKPYLLVASTEATLDVYDAMSGEYLRSIYDLGFTPYMVHPVSYE
ncbi:MAG TPA: amine dehydrogenase large subunit [Pseudomonadales bacterium]